MKRSQRGYVGAGGVVLIAIVVGLIAAWNMGVAPDPLKWLRVKTSPATPAQGEFADRSDDASLPLAHISVRGHVSVPMALTAVRAGQNEPEAYLLVRTGQGLGLDIPRGRYLLSVERLGDKQPGGKFQPGEAITYDVELTAGGLLIDLNRQNYGRLPFPFEHQ